MVTVVPSPGSRLQLRSCRHAPRRTAWRAAGRGRPPPPRRSGPRRCGGSGRTRASWSAGAMPRPLSETMIRAASRPPSARSSTRPPSVGVERWRCASRLPTAWRSRRRSPVTTPTLGLDLDARARPPAARPAPARPRPPRAQSRRDRPPPRRAAGCRCRSGSGRAHCRSARRAGRRFRGSRRHSRRAVGGSSPA